MLSFRPLAYALLIAFVLPLCVPEEAEAQLRRYNFRKRNKDVQEKRVQLDVKDLERNSDITNKRFNRSTWELQENEHLKEQQYQYERNILINEKYAKQDERFQYDMKDKEYHDKNREIAKMQNLNNMMRDQMARKYTEAAHITLYEYGEGVPRPENMLEEASLQDMNPYYFRRNRSSAEGVPVDEAGGDREGEEPELKEG